MLGQALSVHREKRIATEFPDLNLMDYHVMDALSEAMYRQRREKFASTDELKTAIMARVVLDSFFRTDSTLTHMTIQVTQLRLNSNPKFANLTQLRLNSKPKFTNLTQL